MISKKRIFKNNENAVSGLELLILLVGVILVTGYFGFGELSHRNNPALGDRQKQGMIPEAVVATSNLLTISGDMTGYPSIDGAIDGVPILFASQNPAMLGAYQVTIQPFMMTTGAIDLGHASVLWECGNDHEILSLVQTEVLVCPNWTITQKSNFIPLKGADEDLFLEDTEQFTLLVCPAGHAAPYQQFTMTISPKNGEILPLTRTVPFIITPYANLG
jgi:hypothetical protein